MNVYFLGPVGTFTHDAARSHFRNCAEVTFVPCGSPPEVLRRMKADSSTYGVVPIENSVYGEVIPTLDALCFEFDGIYVVGEVSLPVSFDWFGLASSSKPNTVISHPHALAQCKRFLSSEGLIEQSTSSTAEACRIVSERGDESLSAIASSAAGANFGLVTLRRTVEDFKDAYTRFLVVGGRLSADPLAKRTMLAVLPPSNAKGILSEFSSVFAGFGVNILSIHNRPLRTGPENYLFVLTIEGSSAQGSPRAAIERLVELGYGIKLLGIYPGWRGRSPAAPWPHLPGLLDATSLQMVLREAVDKCGDGDEFQ